MKRLRVSYNHNDETLTRNSLRYLSKANLTISVDCSCRAPLTRCVRLSNSETQASAVYPSSADASYPQTFPSVPFHRCRCVSVKCVERVLSVLEARVNGLRGRARCVAPRAPADAASAAWSWRALAVGRWRGKRFRRYRCLTLRYSLLLSV